MAFGVTDTIVAGRYAESSLAALSVASAIYMSVYIALMTGIQALMPIWSELQGSKQYALLGQSFRQALYVCLIATIIGMSILFNPGALLDWGQVPQNLRPEIINYLRLLAFALPAALLFRMYSTLNQSLGKPMLVTWLQIGSLAIKIPLSILLTFGTPGIEPMGVAGCALATLIVNYAMLATAIWMLQTRRIYQPYRLWESLEKPCWATIATFARLGIPAGLAILVEVTSFTLMALFIARLGTVAAASHQIAANLAAVMYMMPLAIGIASSSRVSFWLGAGQPAKAQSVIKLAFMLSLGTSLLLCAALLASRPMLAEIYARSPEVIALTVTLLGWVAVFMVFDSLQAVGLFILRCFRITVFPLAVYCVLLWGLGLYGGYLLAYVGIGSFKAMQMPAAFWMTNSLALAATTVIFWLMLVTLTNKKQ